MYDVLVSFKVEQTHSYFKPRGKETLEQPSRVPQICQISGLF